MNLDGYTNLHITRVINNIRIPTDFAYVGVALPGEAGSWQRESKMRTDEHAYFTTSNVRTGEYNLYAYVSGFIGDYKMDATITINAGSFISLGDLIYEPPRDGPPTWEIGILDRTAAEFSILDPYPRYINKLYVSHDK